MRVLSDKDIDRKEWSRLVQSSSTGTWFQTPEAYEFFASMPELFRPFVFAIISKPESDSGSKNKETLRGVCVGYVTKEKNPIKQIFTRRAIIIGGPALADDCTDEEVIALMKAVREMLQSQAIYVETRNFNDYSRWKGALEAAGFEYQAHLNFHVDCSNAEAMWNRMSDNRRRQIKKALKNGVEITEAQNEQEVAEWYEILKELYRTKVKTPLFPLSFFLKFGKLGVGKYLIVKYEGRIIGGIMCPILEHKGIYEWFVCGKDSEYRNQNPSVMATYAAMEYGHKHGLPRFDFMGAGKPNEPYGVREFKARFGGEEVEYGRFQCIKQPLLYRIGFWGVKILKKIR